MYSRFQKRAQGTSWRWGSLPARDAGTKTILPLNRTGLVQLAY